ncbi:MAG: ABC transporter ATP-binding protein [Lentisphaerae bacterium]|nr:ABC transporter ATP-binding protein [Lentisphaerota bacterium]
MNEPATIIDVRQVSKCFRLQQMRGESTIKAMVVDILRGRAKTREFWALRDITFAVKQGQTVGIIGANGAGKSTLLSLISQTTNPTSGSISTTGRVSSLLELGAGFHPDLTGRENVFLYGAIMGLSRHQMEERFDQIVAFAEMADWIDEPVKHYSSGMYVRLAFSVAVEVDPDILIIDEVLAVGDAAFQRKCIGRINQFKRRGKTLLVVSHDLGTIHKISDQLILMEKGCIIAAGDPDAVVAEYQWLSREKSRTAESKEWGTGEIKIKEARFLNKAGEVTQELMRGESLCVEIGYSSARRIESPVFGFSLQTASGTLIYGNNTQIEDFVVPDVEGEGSITLTFDKLELLAGAYLFSFSVHSSDHLTNYHRLDNALPINVKSDKRYEGLLHMPVRWGTGAGPVISDQ